MPSWTLKGTLWVYEGRRWLPGRPLAMFDFDSTLHRYKNKGPRAEQSLGLLSTLSNHAEFNIVIFSNRAAGGAENIGALKDYVRRLEEKQGHVDVYASTARDRNRKPQLGGWEAFCAGRGVRLTPGLRACSYFCGDAAGRAADFSANDRRFAGNIGVPFYVPEQLFGAAHCARPSKAALYPAPPPPVDEERYGYEAEMALAESPERRRAADDVFEAAAGAPAVIMVGSPASGKSTFARRLKGRGFVVASLDAVKTKAKLYALIDRAVASGKKVVVDNTNSSRQSRRNIIEKVSRALNQHGYPLEGCRILVVWAATPRKVCLHLDGLRCDSGKNVELLPRVVIPTYWKYFEQPRPEELGDGCRLARLDFAWAEDTPGDLRARRYW